MLFSGKKIQLTSGHIVIEPVSFGALETKKPGATDGVLHRTVTN